MSWTLDPALVAQGYRRAREVTRRHARSFFFASHLLFGARRRAAFALYAFCRRLDDLVDEGEQEGVPERLARARLMVAEVYLTLPELAHPGWDSPAQRLVGAPAQGPWDAGELAALEHTVHAFRIPERPFQELISGMEMDLTKSRYASWAELDLYCYRVAGVVGLMLNPVLGAVGPEADGPAADLGRAMQLTNILRDVREDLGRGRVYLPQDELARFGLTEQDLAQGTVDARWRDFVRFQISRARALYASALQGVPLLGGFLCGRMVRLMAALYGDILGRIERQDYDVFRARAHTRTPRKLALAVRALAGPTPRALPAPQAPAALLPERNVQG